MTRSGKIQECTGLKEMVVINQLAQEALIGPTANREPLDFHRRLPGYAKTRLYSAARIAAELGVAKAWVKDESTRFGLPAFKILGASWAVYRALIQHFAL